VELEICGDKTLAERRFWSDLGENVGNVGFVECGKAEAIVECCQCAIIASTNVANSHLELERNHAIVMIENWNWLLATLPHWQHLTSETRNPKPELIFESRIFSYYVMA